MAAKNSTRPSLHDRFASGYAPCPMSGCWLWMHGYSSSGYGRMYRGKVLVYAHRFSWEVHNGAIPDGLCVLHRCDVPVCVNPAHLFLGTPRDNMLDMWGKGRQVITPPKGEAHWCAKLCAEQIIAIRRDPRLGSVLADLYGVSQTHIYRIKSRKSWCHI